MKTRILIIVSFYMLTLLACNDHNSNKSISIIHSNTTTYQIETRFYDFNNDEIDINFIEKESDIVVYSGSTDTDDFYVNESFDSAVIIFEGSRTLSFNRYSESQNYGNVLSASSYTISQDSKDHKEEVYFISEDHYNDSIILE